AISAAPVTLPIAAQALHQTDDDDAAEAARLARVLAQALYGDFPCPGLGARQAELLVGVRPAGQKRHDWKVMRVPEAQHIVDGVGERMKRRQLDAAIAERRQMPHAAIQLRKLGNRSVG